MFQLTNPLVLGHDASSYDTPMDWKVAASRGIKWATIRITAGAVLDSQAVRNMVEAKAAGIARCPYHYFKLQKGTALAQALFFINNYIAGDLPPVLDLEDTRTTWGWKGIATDILIWLHTVEDALHIRPMIYTNPAFIKNYFIPANTELAEYKLIAAQWQINAPLAVLPFTPANIVAWQITDHAWGPYYGMTAKEIALYVSGELLNA